MEKHHVGTIRDWPAGKCRIVTAGGVEIGVFRLDDEYKAYRNVCPHAGAPVCTGPVTNQDGQWLLHCPWHWWQFDLATGATPASAASALEAYAIEVSDEQVYVWV